MPLRGATVPLEVESTESAHPHRQREGEPLPPPHLFLPGRRDAGPPKAVGYARWRRRSTCLQSAHCGDRLHHRAPSAPGIPPRGAGLSLAVDRGSFASGRDRRQASLTATISIHSADAPAGPPSSTSTPPPTTRPPSTGWDAPPGPGRL